MAELQKSLCSLDTPPPTSASSSTPQETIDLVSAQHTTTITAVVSGLGLCTADVLIIYSGKLHYGRQTSARLKGGYACT